VEGIDMIKECLKTVLFTGPYEENIIYVSPPNPWAARCSSQHLLFKPRHEETSK